jgi:arylsulfatase A-like enzyme
LSQPALWAGGLIQRAMYVKPFSAVDNLERLLLMGGYRRYISIDQILSIILEDDANLTRLDAHLAHPDREEQAYKFDICTTVNELTGLLDRDRNDRRPIFFYSQPQNLHIRLVPYSKYSSTELVQRGSSEFFKPTVTTLAEVDRCFGSLIAYLKRTGMYDDSIIVLTSDHGDAYGEGGQWGHAFYLGPETLRVPLIMRVPERLREGRTWDLEETALLSDLTPTLYDLLGYSPHVTNALLGRSLLTRLDNRGRFRPRDSYLVQSSYGRVFGLLNPHGEWLYVADANHLSEQFFDLRSGKRRGTPLTQAERIKYRKWLLEDMTRLNSYYAAGSRQ